MSSTFAVRAEVALVAGVVLLFSILAMTVVFGLKPMCESSVECNRSANWAFVRGGISIPCAACAIWVESRAKPASNVWTGGILLLIPAVLVSPALSPRLTNLSG